MRSDPARGWRNEKVNKSIRRSMADGLLSACGETKNGKNSAVKLGPPQRQLNSKEVIISMDCKYFKYLRNLKLTCYSV